MEDTNIKHIRSIFFLFLSVTRINPCLKQQRYKKKLQMTHSNGQPELELAGGGRAAQA